MANDRRRRDRPPILTILLRMADLVNGARYVVDIYRARGARSEDLRLAIDYLSEQLGKLDKTTLSAPGGAGPKTVPSRHKQQPREPI